MKKKVDYLIVGQGLSGSFLAFQLLQQQKSFLVVDQGLNFSSSYIAAGIINPIVLKRLTKTWRVEEFLSYNPNFYSQLEGFFKKSYLFSIPMDKLISSEEEEVFWRYRFDNFALEKYIEEFLEEGNNPSHYTSNFKRGKVKQTSWLNISAVLEDFRKYLKDTNQILESSFDYSALSQNAYMGIEFKQVVFCEGSNAINNPYFKHLPFALNKGQLITIKCDELESSSILKKKAFLLPVGNNLFKAGATFAWSWENNYIEQEKTDLLKQQVEEITTSDYTVIDEVCGIRPASRDRRPLMGRHTEYRNYYIFNGMGSKGCLMAPLLTQELLQFVEEEKELHKEATIDRFKPSLNA